MAESSYEVILYSLLFYNNPKEDYLLRVKQIMICKAAETCHFMYMKWQARHFNLPCEDNSRGLWVQALFYRCPVSRCGLSLPFCLLHTCWDARSWRGTGTLAGPPLVNLGHQSQVTLQRSLSPVIIILRLTFQCLVKIYLVVVVKNIMWSGCCLFWAW